MNEKYDVVIIGAGAAGMMSAIEAGKRGRKTLLIDHSKKIGENIDGFLKKNKIKRSDLQKKKTDKGDFYFYISMVILQLVFHKLRTDISFFYQLNHLFENKC